jgi:two-component system, NarL family, sensor histidine kinase DevS
MSTAGEAPDPRPAGSAATRRPAGDLEPALAGLCELARERTGAGYAALGILDRERFGLEHFVTAGIDASTGDGIGEHPRGRGVLGLLIADPRPLRIDDLTVDQRHYGFPDGHPEMRDFRGAPILVGGEALGNVYVADKRTGAFDDADEQAMATIANRAADILRSARSTS